MERRLKRLVAIYHGGDSEAVTRRAEELYFAFRVTAASVWQTLRQVENYQAMIARHEVTEPEQRRALALALAHRFGALVEHWKPLVDAWGMGWAP